VSTVALPRWVVGLLVGGCALGVVAVAFLFGRVTAPAASTAPKHVDAGGPRTDAGAAYASRAASGAVPDAGAPSSPGSAFGQGPASDVGAGSAGAARAEDRAAAAADAAAVAAYFRQMDAVAVEAKTSQDPQALARSVLDQALSGNMGSIDALIVAQRSLQTRMAQIVPPLSCREHHERSVLLFARSVALLDRTRAAMTGQGTTDLSGIAVEGRAIEEEARAVDAMANDLRRAAGLAPVS
jgi:hypothetical protein